MRRVFAMRPTSRILSFSVLCALAACGGGGHSTPPAPKLSGTLTIPNLSMGETIVIDERGDDDAFCAAKVGPLNSRMQLRGRVGGDDPLDVRRTAFGQGGVRVAFDAGAGAVAWVFETSTGRQVARIDSGSVVDFDVRSPLEIDLTVSGGIASVAWHIDLRVESASATAAGATHIPLDSAAPEQRSSVQAHWLGAIHPMEAGEVVVLRQKPVGTLEPQGFDLGSVRLEPVQVTAGDPISVYRLPATTTAASVTKGAPVEWSLEMETCLAALRASQVQGVRAASPNLLRFTTTTEPNDTHYHLQWHYKQIRMDQAWDITTGDAGVVVGIIDTGIVQSHPEFSGRLVQGFDFISSATRARDGNGIDNNPEDEGDQSQPPNSSWHGTHVAGTIGAKTNNGAGVAGMDWACKLMALRALGVGGGSSADILEAVRYAAGLSNASGTTPQPPAVPKGRCDVVNMSLGGPSGSTVEQQVYADVRAAGVLVVVAAGNESTSSPSFPAAYPSNLSVGAVRFDKTLAPYSNFGSTVDVVAPGGDLTQDQNGDSFGDGVLSCLVDASKNPIFAFENGTSMASPHVAGLASLLLAVDPNLTADQLFTLITTHTEDLGAAGRDDQFGNGLIDPLAALRAASNSVPIGPVLRAAPSGVNFGDTTTATSVQLVDDGVGTVNIDVPGTSVAYAAGGPTGWLGGTFVTSAGGTISHDRLDLTVDRTGIAAGSYTATVTIATTNANSFDVTVSMGVAGAGSSDTVFVLLVDGTTFDTVFQAETTEAQNWQFHLDATSQAPIANGSYLLVAGTDRNNDNVIGDDGELFGIWPNSDSPQAVAVDSQSQVTSGLDFALELVQQVTGVRPHGRAFRLLPH